MITDELANKTDNKQIIEVLIGNESAKVWIPIMTAIMYTVDKEGDLNKVEAVRVRDLGAETKASQALVVEVGDKFQNKDKNYDKPLEVLQVLPRGMYKVSYDPDFEENAHFLTIEDLTNDFIKL